MQFKPPTAALLAACALLACADPKDPAPSTTQCTKHEHTTHPKNMLWTVEVPTTDLDRAITFYQHILDIRIDEVDMGNTRMGVLPGANGAAAVVLVNGEGYVPTQTGTLAYLEAGDDLQPILDKVSKHGGQVILPKTEISPEMGYFALFTDTEGNKLGLHSTK